MQVLPLVLSTFPHELHIVILGTEVSDTRPFCVAPDNNYFQPKNYWYFCYYSKKYKQTYFMGTH